MTKEEAIRRIKAWNLDSDDMEVLSVVIPELAESEDERMGRELLEYAKGEVRSYNNMVSGDYDSRDKEDKKMHEWWKKIVTYLERQKEQKSSLNFDVISSWLRDHARNYVNGEYNEFHHCVDYDGTIDVERLIADLKVAVDSDAFDVHEQKDQKSVECIEFDNEFKNQVSHLLASVINKEWEYDKGFVEYAAQQLLGYAKHEIKPTKWSEENERMRQTAIEACKTVAEDYENSNARFYKCKDWLEYRLKSFLPQPKQEWSEKDKEMLGKVLECIRFAEDHYEFDGKEVSSTDVKLWLLESLHPQPNQEWSEKDKEMKSNIIRTLQYMLENHTLDEELKEMIKDEINWLKSL